MKKTYRIIARHDRGGEHLQNTETGERESLETSDRDETQRICDARNLETQAPFLSLKIGYKLEMQSAAYNVIRKKPIAATQAEDLRLVLKGGGSPTNNYLRRLHNLALDNGWLHHHPAKEVAKISQKTAAGNLV